MDSSRDSRSSQRRIRSSGGSRRVRRWPAFLAGFGSATVLCLAANLAWTSDVLADDRPAVAAQVVSVPQGGRIVFEGDSITYGQGSSMSPFGGGQPTINGSSVHRTANPFPETVQRLLGPRVTVVNHGYPGARITDGARWRDDAVPNLTVLMYGTNDSNDSLRGGRMDIGKFVETYRAAIERRKSVGGKVLILIPPTRAEHDEVLQQYRAATIDLAREEGVPYLDMRSILSRFPNPTIDGVHLTDKAYETVGQYLASAIKLTN